MNSLERAIKNTEDICDALAAEVVAAHDERVWIRNIDVAELNLRAVKRAEFNRRTVGLQAALGAVLGEVARELGVPAVTMEALDGHDLPEARRLAAVLKEMRALVGTLSQLDRLNRMLGQRALSYVRAHLAVLCPKPSAYNRHGGSGAPGPRTSTVERVV
jgi:hypothetical protein